MDRTIWMRVRGLARALGQDPGSGRYTFTDADIILTLLWAALHDKPVSWACRPESWPVYERRVRRPSPSRMSRRLRTLSVQVLIQCIQTELMHASQDTLVMALDGKVLRVALHSRDAFARVGARGMRGYKLHLICDTFGRIRAWRVTPLNCHEAVIARRIIKPMRIEGYLLADANYDTTYLHDLCARSGGQLVTPRMKCRIGKPLDPRRHTPQRERSVLMLELDHTGFGRDLIAKRGVVERVFARLEMNHHIGQVPAHVRGLFRVRLWMQAIILLDLARSAPTSSQLAAA